MSVSSGSSDDPGGDALAGKFPAGRMVGPYRVSGVLGEGGMGVVYKAEDSRLRRTVALKFIKAGFNERFQREANAISSLNHPHIATLYDVGNYQGAPYLVLEYLAGKPLQGPLSLPVALAYTIQMRARSKPPTPPGSSTAT